jgi:hypothetical protein
MTFSGQDGPDVVDDWHYAELNATQTSLVYQYSQLPG